MNRFKTQSIQNQKKSSLASYRRFDKSKKSKIFIKKKYLLKITAELVECTKEESVNARHHLPISNCQNEINSIK